MIHAWLATSLRRFFPGSPAESAASLAIPCARGERISFQAVFRTGDEPMVATAVATCSRNLRCSVRRVGYVPLRHLQTGTPADDLEGTAFLPGLVPDPLFVEDRVHAGPHETNAFWFTITVAAQCEPGLHPVHVLLIADSGEKISLLAELEVQPACLAPRVDFPITHWLYADALVDYYGVDLGSSAFWELLDSYFANYAEHGLDMVMVPLLTPPLDGVKRPTQLLGISLEGGQYTFDWTWVDRWIEAARANGIHGFEWSHLFSQWGARYAPRVYEGHGETKTLLWSPRTGALSPAYVQFLEALLPELERFVVSEQVLEQSWFHISDEPHVAPPPSADDDPPIDAHTGSYAEARALLHKLAPWMRVLETVEDPTFVRDGLVDMGVPLLPTAPKFVAEGLPSWTYFCCLPRGRFLNRLLDTPLTKIRMTGWLLHRLGAQGFLHWGYNYWYRAGTTDLIDPYDIPDGARWPEWAAGDPFVVYPGPSGPVDSIRWEVFAESLQDLALLRAAEIDPDDPSLADIRDYADFPRDAAWIDARRRSVLARVSADAPLTRVAPMGNGQDSRHG
jgi:hypothetical protein